MILTAKNSVSFPVTAIVRIQRERGWRHIEITTSDGKVHSVEPDEYEQVTTRWPAASFSAHGARLVREDLLEEGPVHTTEPLVGFILNVHGLVVPIGYDAEEDVDSVVQFADGSVRSPFAEYPTLEAYTAARKSEIADFDRRNSKSND